MSVINYDFSKNLRFMNEIIGDEIHLYPIDRRTTRRIGISLTIQEIKMFRKSPKIISLLKKLNDEVKIGMVKERI